MGAVARIAAAAKKGMLGLRWQGVVGGGWLGTGGAEGKGVESRRWWRPQRTMLMSRSWAQTNMIGALTDRPMKIGGAAGKPVEHASTFGGGGAPPVELGSMSRVFAGGAIWGFREVE
jgi:hypothetical protein